MLTEQGCRSRRERLWKSLPASIQWILIADPRHINYLSGFWINPVSHSLGERAFLSMERGGETVLLCDDFAYGSAVGKPFVDETIVEPWYAPLPSLPNRDHLLISALSGLARRFRGRQGLIEAEWFPALAVETLGLQESISGEAGLSLSDILKDQRRAKDPDELELLRRSARAGEAGHLRARSFVAPGVTELEVYAEIQAAATVALGETALVYGDFRASGSEGIQSGGPPRDYVLKSGDSIILDFSVVVAGYRCDFTNTLAVGSPTDGQKRLMDLCKRAMDEGERVLAPGVQGREVHRAVAAPLADAGHPLPHHAGHGLGLGHPEAPAFLPNSEERLRSGDVVTLEPGAYVEGVGAVRIENNYLITDMGAERITHHEISL